MHSCGRYGTAVALSLFFAFARDFGQHAIPKDCTPWETGIGARGSISVRLTCAAYIYTMPDVISFPVNERRDKKRKDHIYYLEGRGARQMTVQSESGDRAYTARFANLSHANVP